MSDTDLERWQGRPRLAKAVRAVALLAPLIVSIVVAILVGRRLPPAESFGQLLMWWVVLSTISTTVLLLMNRLVRRLLPLAVLLRLSLVFPDRAPSRYKIARSVATTRQLAAEVARARDEGQIDDRQQAAETVLKLVAALNVHDKATRGHAERVRIFSDMIAEEMGLGEEDVARLRWASLLHDVGKITVHPDILNKPGKPTDEEWEQLRNHPLEGAKITAPLNDWLGEWSLAIEQHHEMYDGSGYPYGLKGKQISLGARIVSVADVFDVMTSARSYKSAMTATAAREELARCAGQQFDPDVVRAFLAIAIGRLRLAAAGPLSWLTNAAVVRDLAPQLGQMAGLATGATAAVAGIAGYGLVPGVSTVPLADVPTPPAAVATETPTAQPVAAAPRPTGTPVSTPAPATTPAPTSAPAPAPVAPQAPASPEPLPTPAATTPAPEPEPTTAPTTPDPTPEPEPTPQNRAPQATADVVEAREDDERVEFDVRLNDTDPDNDDLSVVDVVVERGGTAVVTPEGLVRFAPNPNWSGTAKGTYTLTDGLRFDEGRFEVEVLAVNDVPWFRAGTQLIELREDDPAFALRGWAVDISPGPGEAGQPLDFEVEVSDENLFDVLPEVDVATGELTFEVAPNAFGAATMSVVLADEAGTMLGGDKRTTPHIATIVVSPVNDAPVARDDAAATNDVLPVLVDVIANDSDLDGDPLRVARILSVDEGTAVRVGTRRIRYTPVLLADGPVDITYVVTDPGGAEDVGTLTVDVSAVTVPNLAPQAVDDAFDVAEDAGAAPLDVLANDLDLDGDALTVTGLGAVAPTLGDAVVAPDGTVTYTPDPDVSGEDTFSYVVSDGTLTDEAVVTVTVTPVNDPPVADDDTLGVLEDAAATVVDVLTGDTDVEGDALTVTGLGAAAPTLGDAAVAPDGTVTYTPDPDAFGEDTFSYVVSDGTLTDEGLVTVTIQPVNDAPVTAPDDHSTTQGTTLVVPAGSGVLANDLDVDGDVLDAVVTAGPDPATQGTLVMAADGSFTFDAAAGFTGDVVATYTADDGTAAPVPATLTITVYAPPSTTDTLHLTGTGVDAATNLATTSPPASTGDPFEDWDGDSMPGWTVQDSNQQPDETDPDKFREWAYTVPAGGLRLLGVATVDLWLAETGMDEEDVDHSAWLYDCDRTDTCTLVTSTVDIHHDNWTREDAFVRRTAVVGGVDHTFLTGHTLRLRLMFDHKDILLPLTAEYPAILNLPVL